MDLNSIPAAERINIGFFGLRNAGKSSLVNAITNQQLSVVSSVKGTTTDPVKKAMELLPLGAVMMIDTAGIDDDGEVGLKRVESARAVLEKCHIAVLVTEAGKELNQDEQQLISAFKEKNLPYIIAKNKADLMTDAFENSENVVYVSAENGTGIEELKNALGNVQLEKKKISFAADFASPKDVVILVTPIDASAPKGRLIMPQQMAVRDILDKHAVPVLVQPSELKETLANLGRKPSLVITDSQVFSYVNELVPQDIPLTSFSILMARYKGFLAAAVKGAKAVDKLENGAKILISEGCTHHRQCGDIGRDKLPNWLENYTNKAFDFQWTSGADFPSDLSQFDLVIHCGGCMLNDREMQLRRNSAENQGTPFTNYGTVIAYLNGILDRSIEMISEL